MHSVFIIKFKRNFMIEIYAVPKYVSYTIREFGWAAIIENAPFLFMLG